MDVHLRRLVQADIGEDEVPKEQRFQLLEKYGVTAPRIDRRVKKPSWMGEQEWKIKLSQWRNFTKPLVTRYQASNREVVSQAGKPSSRTERKPYRQNPHPKSMRRHPQRTPPNPS